MTVSNYIIKYFYVFNKRLAKYKLSNYIYTPGGILFILLYN